ncbi:MAG: acyl-CoA dehydrogenase family protein [bacterium]|nr:acyl-CoA dehydrogenase family protein [bacterium]
MVDFTLTDEQRDFQKLAHDFAVKEIRPVAEHHDETEEMPWEVMRKAHRLGLTTFYFPEEYGGGGVQDPITHFIINEELAWGCGGIQTCISSTGLAAAAIMGMGTEAQKEQWIPMFCGDELRIGAMALTEPEAGSDAQAIKTVARRENDSWVLNGKKCFITNGGIADLHVVFATTDPSLGWAGLAGFVIEKDTPGLVMGKKEKKLGVRASHTSELFLDDCRIPVENQLGFDPSGGAGFGALGALKMLEYTRPGVGSAAVGIARAAYEFALEYAQQRVQFGKPILTKQAISFPLADMATAIDAARLLCWRAGWMQRQNLPFKNAEGSMAKLFAGDTAMWVTTQAVQILGGYGYMKDFPVERWMRDAKIYQIWEGTAEIQRLVISRAVAGRGFF